MKYRSLLDGAAALAFAAMSLTPVTGAGQTARPTDRKPAAPTKKPWTPPRTPDGKPDLQGIWDFRTATPLERPRDFAGKQFFTDEEAAEFEKRAAERIDGIIAVHPPFWLDYGMKVLGDKRTALIVDPPDGRVPALTADALKKAAARAADRRGPPEGPEDFNLQERCILFSAGPPIVPGPYNNNLQIVQTGQAIMVMTEMIHDVRVVPMDGRPHLPDYIRPWLGDSRGRWDGDTLVIETTNFSERTTFRGSDTNLRLIERLSLVDPNTLMYEFTMDNPTAFTRPWTVALPMTRTNEQIYEYACHEGNYGMLGALRGARAEEEKAAGTPKKP